MNRSFSFRWLILVIPASQSRLIEMETTKIHLVNVHLRNFIVCYEEWLLRCTFSAIDFYATISLIPPSWVVSVACGWSMDNGVQPDDDDGGRSFNLTFIHSE